MRILIILENYYPRIGGVETFFKSLVDKLDAQGHQVTVLTNRYDIALPPIVQVGHNITIIRKRYYNRYIFTFGAWLAALKYARKSDLIHTTSYNAAVPSWIVAKMTGTKSIITFHERWGNLWYRLPWMSGPVKILHKAFEWMITKFKFDRFVGVSEFTKDRLIEGGVDQDRVVRIYNGMKYEGFPKHSGSKAGEVFTFLYYGRVGYAKGLDILLKAYHLLLQRDKNKKLQLVLPSEDTRLFRKVKDLIKQLNIGSDISIVHDLEYSDLLQQIARADAVVIPSYSEGFCFAAVETMAIGTPIISSGQGALKEVVTGRHITLEEYTAEMMSKAMLDAIQGKWTEIEIKKYELSDTVDAYLKLYEEVIGK